jgi:hypothetical protein
LGWSPDRARSSIAEQDAPTMSEPFHSRADDLRRAGVGDLCFDRKHRVVSSTDPSICQIEPIGVLWASQSDT